MTEDKNKNEDRFFRLLKFVVELLGWFRILASPLLIGIIIGALIYFPDPSSTRLVIGICVAALGLLIGVIWATKKWKGEGTISFLSKLIATPELDKNDEEIKTNSNAIGK